MIMKRLLLPLIMAICLWSCDDGDIIVSDFSFDEESSLNRCAFEFENSNITVLHIVTESNEAISFRFSENILDNIDNIIQPDVFEIPIDNNNRVNFRRLDGNVDSSTYFCQPVPPSEPTVVEEFVSTSGGSVIFTVVRDSGPDVDTDKDGIPDLQERMPDGNGGFEGDIFDYDKDEDGIPNFLDTDDDNDNVPTIIEIGGTDAPDIALDTDGNDIPNYLDADDDGDGTITRYEDLNAFEEGTADEPVLNPRDDDSDGDSVPNYLDASISESETVDFFRDNEVSRNFNITVVFNNITLRNAGTGDTIRFNSQGFGTFTFGTTNEIIEFRE